MEDHKKVFEMDLAKPIGSQGRPEPGKTISGTVPFMSIRLLERWLIGNDIYHNPNPMILSLECGCPDWWTRESSGK
ncbi:hypothetical protein BS47DRAFT_146838 [Hydnum rufescens UP504]|uniref:Uncharacterized protein n=1 Tax=Hydnum rufescens UP504 TaxID=1448309 RepID=A0A9P6APD1_9AGAM|nr:hypothetical protein BS47DRAFT_146838 [Hydnum rufescens UP504]